MQTKMEIDSTKAESTQVGGEVESPSVQLPRENKKARTTKASSAWEHFTKVEDSVETGKKIESVTRQLFEEYKSLYMDGEVESSKDLSKGDMIEDDDEDITSDFTRHLAAIDDIESKCELDKYLSESCERIDDGCFDILGWWKHNSHKYKILSKMAKDILAIPLSTVASESAFSTEDRVLESSRSTLSPQTVETLICLQNWIRSSPISEIEDIAGGDRDEIAKVAEEAQAISGITVELD